MLSKSGDLNKIWSTILGIILCVRLDQQKGQIGSALPLLKQVISLCHNHCLCVYLVCVCVFFSSIVFSGAFQPSAFCEVQAETTSHCWKILNSHNAEVLLFENFRGVQDDKHGSRRWWRGTQAQQSLEEGKEVMEEECGHEGWHSFKLKHELASYVHTHAGCGCSFGRGAL